MPFTALDHVGYAVSDVDRSVAWYANFLQVDPVPVVDYGPDYLGDIVGYPGCRIRVALLPLPSGLLELIEYVDPPLASGNDLETYQVGNAHLCLVTSDLAAEYERLETSRSSARPSRCGSSSARTQGLCAATCAIRTASPSSWSSSDGPVRAGRGRHRGRAPGSASRWPRSSPREAAAVAVLDLDAAGASAARPGWAAGPAASRWTSPTPARWMPSSPRWWIASVDWTSS